MKHGEPQHEVGSEFFGDDPELALVNADMTAWREANPCLADDPDPDVADRNEELCMESSVCRCRG